MMTPLLCAAVALTSFGLLIMLLSAWVMTGERQVWPARIFDGGAGIFGLALIFWLIVAIAPFLSFAGLHVR